MCHRNLTSEDHYNSAVTIDYDGDLLWIYPTGTTVDKLKRAGTALPPNGSPPGGLDGTWLFPYIADTDGAPTGPDRLGATPINPTRSSAIQWDQNPIKGLSEPASLWLSNSNAEPVAFAYAMRNYVNFTPSMAASSPVPIGWRADIPSGGAEGGSATVWALRINLDQQGLLLSDCTKIPGGRRTPEPAFDAARFVPFWKSIIAEVKMSADRSGTLRVQPPSTQPGPDPVLMDEPTRQRVRMREALLPMALIAAGLLVHE
jgi:hypothetical protein